MSDSGVSISSIVKGFKLPLEGGRLLVRERRLWSLALVSTALSVAAFTVAISLVVGYSTPIYDFATGWLPVMEAAHWYSWIWVAPAKLLFWVLGGVTFLLIAGACMVVAYLVASLVGSPIHDSLSQRVEEIVTGAVEDASGSGVSSFAIEAVRSMVEEIRRLLFFFAIVTPLAFVGFVIPGGQLLTGPLIMVITLLFLPLDYASYTLDRRHMTFANKRQWLAAHRGSTLGFGGAAFLVCMVPGLNLFAMPVLVVAGTLLAIRCPAGEPA